MVSAAEPAAALALARPSLTASTALS